MADLTIAQMIENQNAENEISSNYRTKAAEEEEKIVDLQAQADAALLAGDEDLYATLIASIATASAAADKYAKLADGTNRKIYTGDECRAEWESELETYMSSTGDYGKEAAVFAAALEAVYTSYCNLSTMIRSLRQSAFNARSVLVDTEKASYDFRVPVSGNGLIDQIREMTNRCHMAQ